MERAAVSNHCLSSRLSGDAFGPHTRHMIRAERASEGWSSRRSRSSPALWAGAGFVAGIVFWHMVGFWTLVTTAVVADGDKPKSQPMASMSRPPPPPLETGSVRRTAMPACVALALNRSSGVTQATPCAAGPVHQARTELGGKADKAIR